MRMIKRPENVYAKYHAHVYYDEATLGRAQKICTRAGELFGVAVGRLHQKNVGPHPRWSCQLTFDATQFDGLIPWLEENREGLTVLVHALTGKDLDDHTVHAAWLGDPVELNLAMFRKDGV
jgi:aromatic ring-cleaving dioxygenase